MTAKAATAMSDTPIVKLTVEALRSALQQVGYRVEEVTDPVTHLPYLRSATGGLAFDVRPGNRLSDLDDGFVDIAFTAILQVQGELPLEVVNRWNTMRRFARLQLSQPFLVLCLDVSVAGGVMANHLRGQIEIWDRLVQELITYLREELRQLSAKNGASPPPGPEAQERERAAEAGAKATIQ
jgi:hypothetical protein